MLLILATVIFTVVIISGCTQSGERGMPFGQNPGGPEQYGTENYVPRQGPPQVNPNAPLPELPAGVPAGEFVTQNLGDIEAQYFSTAIARGLSESGTDFFITLKNTGNAPLTVCFTTMTDEFRKQIPAWNLHFFAMQNPPFELQPQEGKKLWYFASLDLNNGNGFFDVNFTISDCKTNTINIPVVFGVTDERFWGRETSSISGTISDESGNPVSHAPVTAILGCGRVNFNGESDEAGTYSIPVLGMEDINAIYLGKPMACDSLDYYLTVDHQEYEYFYAEHIAPTRAQPKTFDIVLEKKMMNADYSMAWQKKIEDNFGFFWIRPSDTWDVFAVSQAKHPPELNKPAHVYMIDGNGNVVWTYPTENECWGIDIAKDGSNVVAGCHDGTVYVVDKAGKLVWKSTSGTMVRSACISHDGTTILSGPRPTLFNAETGAKKELAWTGDWLRNCAFYQDDSGFVAGSRELTSFDMSGSRQWQNIVGEFPLFMDVDSGKNVYASGKSRTLFSFDASGKLRWKHKIAEPTITAGAATPDGSRIAAGSVGGSVYLFDNSGNLLWKRGVLGTNEFSAVGHNAIAISDDGKRIVAGTDSNCIVVYNERGTLLWKTCIDPETSNPDLKPGVTNVQISSDTREIIATYGDNYIRKFTLAG